MSRFKTINEFEDSGSAYTLLPFRFAALDDHSYVVTNMVGEHHVLSHEALQQLVKHSLSRESTDFSCGPNLTSGKWSWGDGYGTARAVRAVASAACAPSASPR